MFIEHEIQTYGNVLKYFIFAINFVIWVWLSVLYKFLYGSLNQTRKERTPSPVAIVICLLISPPISYF